MPENVIFSYMLIRLIRVHGKYWCHVKRHWEKLALGKRAHGVFWLVVVCSQSVRRWMVTTIDDPWDGGDTQLSCSSQIAVSITQLAPSILTVSFLIICYPSSGRNLSYVSRWAPRNILNYGKRGLKFSPQIPTMLGLLKNKEDSFLLREMFEENLTRVALFS